MNLKQEVRAAWVAQEIKRLLDKQARAQARAFKTERPPRAAQQPKEQPSRAEAAQPAQPPGDTRPPVE